MGLHKSVGMGRLEWSQGMESWSLVIVHVYAGIIPCTWASTHTSMDSEKGCGSVQVHSSNDDWDLEFPTNREIEELIHTSECETSESEGGEAATL
jgi:hypothetical protein